MAKKKLVAKKKGKGGKPDKTLAVGLLAPGKMPPLAGLGPAGPVGKKAKRY